MSILINKDHFRLCIWRFSKGCFHEMFDIYFDIFDWEIWCWYLHFEYSAEFFSFAFMIFFSNPKKWRRLFWATPASASSPTQSPKSDNENFKGPIAGWSCERCWYSCQAGLWKPTYPVEEKLREQRRKYAKPQYLKSIERPSLSRGFYTNYSLIQVKKIIMQVLI